MGSALAAHREVARQAESPFADDVALDVRRPARDRIAEAAHDLIHPFFGAARPAVAAAARTSGFDETMLSDQILREQRHVVPDLRQQQLHHQRHRARILARGGATEDAIARIAVREDRSEEHTSELQSLMRISYAVFCLKKKK